MISCRKGYGTVFAGLVLDCHRYGASEESRGFPGLKQSGMSTRHCDSTDVLSLRREWREREPPTKLGISHWPSSFRGNGVTDRNRAGRVATRNAAVTCKSGCTFLAPWVHSLILVSRFTIAPPDVGQFKASDRGPSACWSMAHAASTRAVADHPRGKKRVHLDGQSVAL